MFRGARVAGSSAARARELHRGGGRRRAPRGEGAPGHEAEARDQQEHEDPAHAAESAAEQRAEQGAEPQARDQAAEPAHEAGLRGRRGGRGRRRRLGGRGRGGGGGFLLGRGGPLLAEVAAAAEALGGIGVAGGEADRKGEEEGGECAGELHVVIPAWLPDSGGSGGGQYSGVNGPRKGNRLSRPSPRSSRCSCRAGGRPSRCAHRPRDHLAVQRNGVDVLAHALQGLAP